MRHDTIRGYHAGSYPLRDKNEISADYFRSYNYGGAGLFFYYEPNFKFGFCMHEFTAEGRVLDLTVQEDQILYLKNVPSRLELGEYYDSLCLENNVDILLMSNHGGIIKNLYSISEWRLME